MSSENLYPWLEPAERVTLLLEAMARGDEVEADRLHRSCPAKTYTQPDAEFQDRLRLGFEWMTLLCIDLRGLWGKLQALDGCLGWVRQAAVEQQLNTVFAFVEGVRCAEGLSPMDWFTQPQSMEQERETRAEDEEESASEDTHHYSLRMEAVEQRAQGWNQALCRGLVEAAHEVAQDLVNTWAAYDRFCRSRLGVSAEGMLKAWQFPAEEFGSTLQQYASVRPQEEKVQAMLTGLCTGWDERFGPEKERAQGG